jgi:UDP-N-acetylglucosamine--N-acetylmuramyl-(pentapeptide) pyrophosphoryl-undecaprenol N-acetylglucosamine transferase
MDKQTIFITGGHPTPAIALIEEIRKIHPSWKCYWVGRKYAFEGKNIRSSEYQLVHELGIPFLSCITGRLQRNFTLQTIPSLIKIPLGFFQSLFLILKYRPTRIVSFGGYVAVPVACAGYLLGVPIVTHEQVQHPGLGNRIIGLFAKKICVSFSETVSFFPKSNVVVTGIPIRSGIFSPPAKPSFSYPNSKLPMLYITGGSTGAQSLNDAVFPILHRLIDSWIIIHQTGEVSYSKAHTYKDSLGVSSSRYIIQPFFKISDLSWIYAHAEIILGRSGANTVAEVSALHKKAIFIPLPWAGGDEQKINAHTYALTGNAVVLDQEKVSEQSLEQALQTIKAQSVRIPKELSQDKETSARRMVQVIEAL